MAYALDDTRNYPSNASGRWTSEPAMPGDFRTARMREYLEAMDEIDRATKSERSQVSQTGEELDRILAQARIDKNKAAWEEHERGQRNNPLNALKDAYSGLEATDIVNLPVWLMKQIDKVTGKKQGPGLWDDPSEHARFMEENPEQFLGFAGGVGPRVVRGAKTVANIGKAATSEAPWAQELGINDPLRMYLDAIESGQTKITPPPPKPRIRRTLKEMKANRTPTDFEYLSPEDVMRQFVEPNFADIPPTYIDQLRAAYEIEPRLGYRIAADKGLQEAFQTNPGWINRYNRTETPFDVGLNYERDVSQQPWARSTGRAPVNEPDLKWRGGHSEDRTDPGDPYALAKNDETIRSMKEEMETKPVQEWRDSLKAGWAEPPKYVPHTLGSRLASPLEIPPQVEEAINKAINVGGSIKQGIGQVGESLGELGQGIVANAKAQMTPKAQLIAEDLWEKYSWLKPTGQIAGAGYLLSKILPALTEDKPTRSQDDSGLLDYDPNDPEGLMRTKRRNEQMTNRGNSIWEILTGQ